MRALLRLVELSLCRILGSVLFLALLLPPTLAAQAISQPSFQARGEQVLPLSTSYAHNTV